MIPENLILFVILVPNINGHSDSMIQYEVRLCLHRFRSGILDYGNPKAVAIVSTIASAYKR